MITLRLALRYESSLTKLVDLDNDQGNKKVPRYFTWVV